MNIAYYYIYIYIYIYTHTYAYTYTYTYTHTHIARRLAVCAVCAVGGAIIDYVTLHRW